MASGDAATLNLYKETSGGSDDIVLEGQLTGTSAPRGVSPGAPGFNTLDEPIKETILRDVRAVGKKFYHVLYPIERSSLLKVRGSRRALSRFWSFKTRPTTFLN